METIRQKPHVLIIFIWISALAYGEESSLTKLRNKLLQNYDRNVRPTKYHTNETIVDVYLYPMYVQDLDEEKHIFTLDGWLHMEWKDEHMKWKREDNGNIASLTFDQDELWRPQVIVFWSSPTSSIDPYTRSPMRVREDGLVMWYPSAVFRTQCVLDYTNYPYDLQRCSFNLTLMSLHANMDLYLPSQEIDLTYFTDKNSKWTLVNCSSLKSTIWHARDIYYTFVLKRRMPYGGDVEWTLFIVILLMTLTMFWMPPERGKKLTLGLVSLLILFGELLYFVLTSPSPAIALYTARMIQQAVFAVVSAVLLEIIVLNLTRITEFPPPSMLLNFLSGPARKFFCFCPQDEKKNSLQRDWYTIALGFDRILFVLYTIVFVSLKTWV